MHSIQRMLWWCEVTGERETINNSSVKKGQFYCEICKYCSLAKQNIFLSVQCPESAQVQCMYSVHPESSHPLSKQTTQMKQA